MNLDRLKEINEQKAQDAATMARHDELILDNSQTREVIVKSFAALVDYLENNSQSNLLPVEGQAPVDISELTATTQALLEEARQLPEVLSTTDNTENFLSLEAAVKSLEQAVRAQVIPEPNVQVDAPDLNPVTESVVRGSDKVVSAVKAIKLPELSTEPLEKLLTKTNKLLRELPDLMSSGGGGGGGRATPYEDATGIPAFVKLVESTTTPSIDGIPVVNPDGTNIGGSGGVAAYSDSGGTDRKGLVDADRHVQVDVLSAPTTTVQATNLDIRDLTSASDSVAAVQSGTWTEANSAAIKTAVETLDNAISGNEMQVDVITMPTVTVNSHAVTNAGTFAVQNTAATPAGTNNIGDVDIASLPTVSTSTDVSLASAATSAQLLASNTSRKGLLLTNTDANAVYVYYGTTATASKFTVIIQPNAYWEMPQPIYTGRIDAIWAANGSGSLIGSELS